MQLISSKPHRICKEFGCDNLTKETYCKDHEHVEREQELKRHKRYNKERDPALIQFYNSKEWIRLRAFTMATNNYLCVGCSGNDSPILAKEVDHIIPIKVDWSLRLEPSNCQPLCSQCHIIKTQEDKRKYNL